MNVAMWGTAVRIIPRVTKDEWDGLDIVSRWLIATRAGVLVMTFIPCGIVALLAASEGDFDPGVWVLMTLGLLLAHATNNLLNDMTDYARGVDQDNYFRAQYGAAAAGARADDESAAAHLCRRHRLDRCPGSRWLAA